MTNTSITVNVSASNADAIYIKTSGVRESSWQSNAVTAEFTNTGYRDLNSTYNSAFHFDGVTVPKGCTIVSAYLKIYTDDALGFANEAIRTRIYGEDVNNAQPFGAGYTGPRSRTFTTNYTTWDWTPSTSTHNLETSPDIKTVIQELVDRSGWGEYSLNLFLDDDSSDTDNEGYFEAYDDVPSLAAELTITYTDIPIQNDRSARIKGLTTGNSSRSAVITGQVPDERDIVIRGGVNESDARNARIRGGLVADPNMRSATILGGVSSSRDASITGTYGWYHPNWSYRKIITIDKDKVANSDQVDFPILINLASDTGLAASTQSLGQDIVFTNNDGTVKYSHEIESFNETTGALVAHVKIPLLSYETDTVIYMYYGNATCESQQDATNVWDSAFKGVWHMKDTTESKNGRSITKKASGEPANSASGQIDGAQSFDGSDDYAQIAHHADFDLATNESMTIEAWLDITNKGLSAGDNYQYFATKTDGADHTYGWDFYTQADGYLRLLLKDDGGTQVYVTDNLTLHAAGLMYVVGVRDVGSDVLRLYVNGAEAITAVADTTTQAITPSGGIDLGFLAQPDSAKIRFQKGITDELRFSKSTSGPRSADWILTTYNTQKDPSTFYELGTEELRGSERSAVITGTAQGDDGQSWKYPGWLYRKAIVIDHTKVASDETNFPVLIKLTTDDELSEFAQTDGDDIFFTDDTHDSVLPHEIELYTTATGQLIAWVNVDNLSSEVDTTIYLYYGNPDCASQQNKNGTWESNFKGVWHLTDNTTSQVLDSTSNVNIGTKQSANNPIQIDGKIYKGQDFDGATSGDKIDFPTASTSLQPAELTFEGWIYRDTDWSAIDKVLFFAKTDSTWNAKGWYLQIKGGQGVTLVIDDGNYIASTETNPNNLFPNAEWCHFIIQFSSAGNTAVLKINNVSKEMGTVFGTPDAISSSALQVKRIGPAAAWTTSYLTVAIDEMRIHSEYRDADWLTTNYNTQSDPATFYALGEPETDYYSYRGARILGGVESNRSARITGKTTDASEKDAVITGGIIETSDKEAVITGFTTDNNEREAIIHGQSEDISNKNRNAKITGKDTSDDERASVISGQVLDNSERESVITGVDTTSSTRSAAITGKLSDNSERECSITGVASYNERSAVITGQTTDNDERDSIITGEVSDNNEREIRITGKDTDNSEREAVTIGKDTSNDTREATITGKAFTDEREAIVTGKVTDNDTREALITGVVNDYNIRESVITGKNTDYITREAVIIGKQSINDEREVVITGKATDTSEKSAVITGIGINSNRDAIITGNVTDNSEREGSLQGVDTANSSREASITGVASTSDRSAIIEGTSGLSNSTREAVIEGVSFPSERNACITGVLSTNDNRSAVITGDTVYASNRNAKITGIAFGSERGAVISGLGVTSDRDATIKGDIDTSSNRFASITGQPTPVFSQRNAEIQGIETLLDTREARITGEASNSIRSANIVGAKCPWYTGNPKTWKQNNKTNWYTDNTHVFIKKDRKIVCNT